MEFTHKFTDK